ncbi:MAG TPA: hemagglutinin repeat-containing protein [Methylophilaceae bacterium]|nr:hemagglutinin repeat-containing protein [Methylophilaceae bacterium]
MSRISSNELPEGLAMLAYNPTLQFFWPYEETSPVNWRNFVRDRYIDSISSLLGGTLDSGYRNELVALVNAMPESAYRDSYNIWTQLLNKINADHPAYIASMATALSYQSFPLTTYRQYCDDTECDYVNYTVEERKDYKDIITSNAPAATLFAGGNASLAVGNLTNHYSSIEAGGNLALTGSTLTNEGAELFKVTDTITRVNRIHWTDRDHGTTTSSSSSSTLIDSVPAIISAGGSLNGSYTSRMDNVTIRQNTAPVATATGTSPATPSLDPISNSSLYRPASNPTAGYLIETDPRFADYRTWLSSDYMLQQLSFDPAMTQQRLGDGFYEQRLVREQVALLTGRRFLDGYANDEAQYQALMNNALTQMNGLTLIPGVALTPAQVAQLTSDIVWLVAQEVTLPDGTVKQALVPQVYVRPQAGDLSPSGALLAGQDVHLEVTGDPANGAGTLTTSGVIAGRALVELDAVNINNVRGRIQGESVKLDAAQDINIEGGTVAAESSLIANAGRDLTVSSSTSDQHVELQGTPTYVNSRVIDRVAGLYVSDDNAVLVASAGRDVNLMAAAIQNSGADTDGTGDTIFQAGRDLNLGTVTETMQSYAKGMNSWRKENATTSVGSVIDTQGDVTLLANNDLTAKAANVTSESGAITAAAGGDITIATGTNTYESDAYRKIRKSSGFGSSKKEFWDSVDETTHTGSTFSGNTVSLQAGLNGRGNTAIEGSNVVSTNGTNIEASGDVSIMSVADVHDETHKFKKKSSGFSTSGASLSYGTNKLKVDQQSHALAQQKSMVGSVSGDVIIQAGETYTQAGSDVVAPKGDIDINAKTVDIESSRNTYNENTETRFKQSGITLSVGGGLIGLAQNVLETTKGVLQSNSGRNKTLNTLQTYANGALLKEQGAATINAVKSGDIEKAAANSGIKVSIGVGSTSMESSSSNTSVTHQSSLVKSGGDVTIKATEGDLAVKGSRISADQNLTLDAVQNINLLASADSESNRSKNKSSSMNVGVSMGIGEKGVGLSFDVAASRGKGMANSDSVTYNNTTVSAGETLKLQSGKDTNLIGANVNGHQVIADVQGDLNIQSLQDTATSQAKQSNTGISVSVPIASVALGNGFGGISQGKQDSNSNYASVYQQSAIKAGEQGFDIHVIGNTELKGAVISSAADADRNRLTTGTLTVSDIHNHVNAKASTSGTTFSSDMLTSKYAAIKGVASNLVNHGETDIKDNSTTTSAVSPAKINITDDVTQVELTGKTAEETVAALNRDTRDTNRVLARPDMESLQEKLQQEQADKLLLTTTISTFTDESFRKMFLSKATMFEVARDDQGNVLLDKDGKPIMHELDETEKLNLKTSGENEKLNVFTNGIFNDEEAAGQYAVQMAEAPAGEKVYLVYFPEANNFFSELLVAAYQKKLEGIELGMTNASQEIIDLSKTYGKDGLNLIGHSRGAMTIGNALEALKSMELNNPLSDTNIKLVGPAYPAQEAANSLDTLSGGKKTTVQLQNHVADFVGRLIGDNPATYGETREGSSLIKEWIKMFGVSPTVHSCYGTGASSRDCYPTYGPPKTIDIPSVH